MTDITAKIAATAARIREGGMPDFLNRWATMTSDEYVRHEERRAMIVAVLHKGGFEMNAAKIGPREQALRDMRKEDTPVNLPKRKVPKIEPLKGEIRKGDTITYRDGTSGKVLGVFTAKGEDLDKAAATVEAKSKPKATAAAEPQETAMNTTTIEAPAKTAKRPAKARPAKKVKKAKTARAAKTAKTAKTAAVGSWKEGTIGDVARKALLAGKSTEEALDAVKKAFPDGATNAGNINWYRGDLRKRGLLK